VVVVCGVDYCECDVGVVVCGFDYGVVWFELIGCFCGVDD